MRHAVDRALRVALSQRSVTCIIVPNDGQELEAVATPPRTHGTVHSRVGHKAPLVLPTEDELARTAAVFNAGKKVAILVGAGALGATDEVIAVADRLGAGVAKALLGKAAVPDDLPFVTGSIGLLGTRPSWEMMTGCDTLLMIGSGFPYSEFLPEEGQARGVQIDIDGRMLSLRYPMEVPMIGDAAASLRALLPRLEHKTERSWRERIEKNIAEWWQTLEHRAMSGDLRFEGSQTPCRTFPMRAMPSCWASRASSWISPRTWVQPGMKPWPQPPGGAGCPHRPRGTTHSTPHAIWAGECLPLGVAQGRPGCCGYDPCCGQGFLRPLAGQEGLSMGEVCSSRPWAGAPY